MALQLVWAKCGTEDRFCALERVNLAGIRTKSGVYVIWHAGSPGRVIRVGCGPIAEKLAAHRKDKALIGFRRYGELLVTWAAVNRQNLLGVANYLAGEWHPLIDEYFHDATPIPARSPWDEAA